jgi:hypothetical protein
MNMNYKFNQDSPNAANNLRTAFGQLFDSLTTGDGKSEKLPAWEAEITKGDDGSREFVLRVPAVSLAQTESSSSDEDTEIMM